MKKYFTKVEPIGCICEGREKILSEICGHLPGTKCDFKRFKCSLCPRRYQYRSWVKNHLIQLHKIDESDILDDSDDSDEFDEFDEEV